jgi:hypothetical protein
VGLSYDEAAVRLGCEANWLIRVETGLAVAAPEEVARILVEYGVRDAAAADQVIDLARRVAAPPPWQHAPSTTTLWRAAPAIGAATVGAGRSGATTALPGEATARADRDSIVQLRYRTVPVTSSPSQAHEDSSRAAPSDTTVTRG